MAVLTLASFTDSAIDSARPRSGQPEFGPLVAILIPIVIGAAISEIVVKVIDILWAHIVSGRTMAARALLRDLYVKPAIRKAERQHGVTLTRSEWQQLEEQAMTGITTAARNLSSDDVRALKAEAEQ